MKYIIGTVIILAVAFYLLNQTGEKSVPHSESSVQLNISNDTTEKDNNSEDEEEYGSEYFELKDVGTPCERHMYQMPSDTMESLLFSIKPDSDMTSETLQLSIKNDKVSKYGISVLPGYAEIITKTVEYPIWVINAGDLRHDEKYRLNKGGKVFITSGFGTKGKYYVDFPDSDSGTGILSAGSNIHPVEQEQFGGHTEEELADILGSDSLSVNFTASWGTDYSWQVSQEYRTREVKIVQASVFITTPDTINGFITLYNAFGLCFTDSLNCHRFGVTYNKEKDIYSISGPGYDVGCFNKQ